MMISTARRVRPKRPYAVHYSEELPLGSGIVLGDGYACGVSRRSHLGSTADRRSVTCKSCLRALRP